MAELVIRCHKKDLACSLEWLCDLAMHGPLVDFYREEEVNPQLLQLSRKVSGCVGYPAG